MSAATEHARRPAVLFVAEQVDRATSTSKLRSRVILDADEQRWRRNPVRLQPLSPTRTRYRDEVVGDGGGQKRAHRAVVVVLAWAAATLLGLVVAVTTRIGPVVLTVSARHGVHLGDLLAFAAAYAAAVVITLRMLASR
jgi:hypothetical protein